VRRTKSLTVTGDDDHSQDTDDRLLHSELRSFGRRRGRALSGRQKQLWDGALPGVALNLTTPCDLASVFGASATETWLEIGFGGGEHLVWQAEQRPHAGLIGCEPFEEGVVKVLTAIEDRALGNIRLHADDARGVLRWLPEASISRAFVLFPDPWPKRKHLKRRLVNAHLLRLLARVIKPGGELRLGTDIADYARTMLIAIQQTPQFRWKARSPDDWRIRPADWPETRYEAKAVREGRSSCYLLFERV
jgi:tRNA (guanine-N7-)-methyltransferase